MKFTVFTPTYNRGDMLYRVYESLIKQKETNFEWLIVDDGSVDNTEQVVSKFTDEKIIEINFIKKENGGKHTAHNLAVNNAKGEWFLCLDSDDFLSDDALIKISNSIEKILPDDCGIICQKITQNGKPLSGNIICDQQHYGAYKYSKCCGAFGEYVFVFKTKILRNYLYPEIANERFMGECVVYDRLEMDGYTLLPLNEIIEICEYQEDGLSGNIINCLKQSPTAYQIYHLQRIDLVDNFRERLAHAVKYHAFKTLSRNKEYLYKGKHRLLVGITYLFGAACSLYYKLK